MARQPPQFACRRACYLIEHINILHTSLGPHPLDLVVRLREVALYSDVGPFRQRSEAVQERRRARRHKARRDDRGDRRTCSLSIDIVALVDEAASCAERLVGGCFDVRFARGYVHGELPYEGPQGASLALG